MRARPLQELTPREKEVARLIGQGLSYAGVAAELDCSPRTVESHVIRIASKIPGRATPLRRVLIWAVQNPDL